PLVGVEHLMTPVVVSRAVEFWGSVLGDQGQLAAGPPAIFGSVVGDAQLGFTHGIHTGREVSGIEVSRILAGGAIQAEDDLTGLAAVDSGNTAARPAAIIVGAESLHARQAHDQRE